jgi:hypothetical protein
MVSWLCQKCVRRVDGQIRHNGDKRKELHDDITTTRRMKCIRRTGILSMNAQADWYGGLQSSFLRR